MSNPQEDHPPRSPEQSPRDVRCLPDVRLDGSDGSVQGQRSSRSNSQYPPNAKTADDCLFDFLYRLIFSLVRSALSVVLSPLLGKDLPTKGETLLSQSFHVTDIELARQESSNSAASSSNSYPPILKTESRRYCDISPEKKSVRFPVSERPRPPLGRIGLSSSSTFVSNSSRSVSSSESKSSSIHEPWRRERSPCPAQVNSSRRKSPPLGRMSKARMHQSSYFVD